MDKSKIANILPRMAAGIVDSFIISLVGGVIAFIFSFIIIAIGGEFGVILAQGVAQLLMLIISFGYYIYFLSIDGTTPGLKYLGLRIVKEDGSIMTKGQVFLRTLVFGLLGIINHIAILVNDKRQGVHDMTVGTICEKVDEQESRAKWIVGIGCGCGCLSVILYFIFAAAIFAALSSGSMTPTDLGM